MSQAHPATWSHPIRLYDDAGAYQGDILLMPDADIANVAKSRCEGVAWACGDYVEVILTSSTFLSGVSPPEGDGSTKPPETEESISARCAIRAQKEVRRICNTNRFRYMWTLTMCPASSKHAGEYVEPVCVVTQRHYKSVRDLWKRFARKLQRDFGGPAWLAVFELHDSEHTSEEKRGTFHIHFATNARLKWADMGRSWGHGNIRYDDFQSDVKERGGKVRNPGAYMSKYVGKAFDKHNRSQKRFSCSRNVLRPLKVDAGNLANIVPQGSKIVFRTDREYDFYDERSGFGGIYGVSQITYQLPKEGL